MIVMLAGTKGGSFHGPAILANHAAIHRHMEVLWSCKKQLDAHLPAEETTVILTEALGRLECASQADAPADEGSDA